MLRRYRLYFFRWQRHGNRRSAARAILLALLLIVSDGYGWGQASIPSTPAGHALRAWLDAINSGNAAKIRAYVKSVDSTQTVDWLMSLSYHSGGFLLLSATDKGPQLISFHVKEKKALSRRLEAYG